MTNTLVQKINADAAVEIATIKATAEAEVAAIAKETQRVVDQLQQQAAEILQKKKTHLELVVTAKAAQAAKIAVQAAKRTAIDALFIAAETQILAESGAVYVARYQQRAVAVLPKDLKVLTVKAPAHRLDETKEIITKLSIIADVQIDDTVRAGLIIVASDGVYDITFDRMLSDARPALEMELVRSS